MTQRVWAIDDLIVNDGANLDGRLTNSVGLPATNAQLSMRHGRWPAVTGVSRPGDRKTLTAFFKHPAAADRKAARIALLQQLNPELEEMCRLTVVDEVLPGIGQGVSAVFGPWDIYCDSSGVWHVRDLLRPDDLEADLAGGWQIGLEGELQFGEAISNKALNPLFVGTYVGGLAPGYTAYSLGAGNGTRSENTDTVRYDTQAQRITMTSGVGGVGDRWGLFENLAAVGATSGALSLWIYVHSYTAGTHLILRGDGTVTGPLAFYVEITPDDSYVGRWVRISDTATVNVAETWTIFLYCHTNNIDVTIDGLQLEGKAYTTPAHQAERQQSAQSRSQTLASTSRQAARERLLFGADARTGTIRERLRVLICFVPITMRTTIFTLRGWLPECCAEPGMGRQTLTMLTASLLSQMANAPCIPLPGTSLGVIRMWYIS
jgi:hypothetical protein